MIDVLNRLVDRVEEHLADGGHGPDLAELARSLGTAEHHLRWMFSSLTEMPLSEHVRRPRLTVAAADVLTTDDDLLTVALRHGCGSAGAFGRALPPCTAPRRGRSAATADPSSPSPGSRSTRP